MASVTGGKGNIPYELACARTPGLVEQFADETSRAMRSGRFLLIIAGDGIREDISGMAELINRNAPSAFSFGLVEVALYEFDDASLAIQPRVIAKTHVIERTMIVVREAEQPDTLVESEESEGAPSNSAGAVINEREEGRVSSRQAGYRAWWGPVLNVRFDDPDQEPPKQKDCPNATDDLALWQNNGYNCAHVSPPRV